MCKMLLLSISVQFLVIYLSYVRQIGGSFSESFLTDYAMGCTRSESEDFEPPIIKIPLNGTREFKFEIPSSWEVGDYSCQWNVVLEESAAADSLGLRFKFISFENTDWNRTDGFGMVRDLGIRIKVPRLEFDTSVRLSSEEQMIEHHTTPNNVQLTFEQTISERKEKPFYFVIWAAELENWPKRYKVKEIIASKSRIIRDYNFSWQESRVFCKRQSPDMDLCMPETPYLCERYSFSHTKTEYDQYFPMLPYNAWGSIDSVLYCNKLPRNPIWGMDKSKCPRSGGCRSKIYIFCCQHESPVRVDKTPGTIATYVTSGRSLSGEYNYRFSDDVNNEKFVIGLDKENPSSEVWSNYFKITGRISGDVDRFDLYDGYSPKASTVVYFCAKCSVNEANPAIFRFKISLKPCESPWYQTHYGYGSRTRKSGTKPIYFGQSREGDGTRVSLTPPCCGYDDPEESFMLYGIVRKSWEARLSSRFCPKSHWFGGRHATISFDHSLETSNAAPVFCSWRIKIPSGRGIKIEYKYESFRSSSNPTPSEQDYLEFLNPVTKRSYGRVRHNETGGFVSDSNIVDLHFVLEDSMGRFSVEYREVPHANPAPVTLELYNATTTWFQDRAACKSNDLNLCSKNDICRTGNNPYGDASTDWSWVAISDGANQWVQLGTGNKFKTCEVHTAAQPPQRWVNQNGYFVLCCKRQGKESPIPQPTRVNIGHHNKLGVYYWYNRAEKWESPSYKFNYDDPYAYQGDGLETVYPWKPPSTFTDAPSNVVDFFTMSSDYEEGYFEQVVIFCRPLGFNVIAPFRTAHQLTLDSCRGIWVYDFHLYASTVRSEKATVELHVGKSDVTTGKACCHSNLESFILYVISAGKVESYEKPEVNVDFDDY